MSTFKIIVKTYFGFEELLADELQALGAQDIEILRRAVQCTVDKRLMYACNYQLRTALFVLRPIAEYIANNEDELYEGAKQIDWDQYLDINQTFAISSVTFGDIFTHSHYAGLKLKDAIVDTFREKRNRRPSVDTNNPDVRIELHVAQNQVSISVNSSGETLSKRGYRTKQTKAPLNEALAAGIIKLSGWTPDQAFFDPMCGSGTFPIEAALMATNSPIGKFRSFAFQKHHDFDPELWQEVKAEADAGIKRIPFNIKGADKNQLAVRVSQSNARGVGFEKDIYFERKNVLNTESKGGEGILIMNPPYGERLEDADEMEAFYADLGTHLKHNYEGWDAWVFSGNLDALKCFGLRPSRKIKLFNGNIECSLRHFPLYKGKKGEQSF